MVRRLNWTQATLLRNCVDKQELGLLEVSAIAYTHAEFLHHLVSQPYPRGLNCMADEFGVTRIDSVNYLANVYSWLESE